MAFGHSLASDTWEAILNVFKFMLGYPNANFRIIQSFFTDLGFVKKMGQLGPPKTPFEFG